MEKIHPNFYNEVAWICCKLAKKHGIGPESHSVDVTRYSYILYDRDVVWFQSSSLCLWKCFTKRDHLPPHTGWACSRACQKSETGTSPAWGSGRRWSPAGPTAAASWSWRWCCGRGSGGWSGRPARTLEGALQVQPERQHKHWRYTKTVSTNDQTYGIWLPSGQIVNCGHPPSSWSVFKISISNLISKLIKKVWCCSVLTFQW